MEAPGHGPLAVTAGGEYTGAPELGGYAAGPGHADLVEYTRAPGGYEGGAPDDGRAHRRHPRVRPQQSQPGVPGEPVWTIRVAPHPYH